MKYIMILILVCSSVILVNTSLGQVPDGQVLVDVDLLTGIQLKKAMEGKPSIETRVSKWTEIGKGIGAATKEGLSAVTEETNKFANTKVGLFTMIMIAYKIIGKDLIQLIIGAPLLITITVLFIWIVRRNYIVRKIISSESADGMKTYEVYQPEEAWYIAVACLIYGLSVGISLLVIFV